MHLWPSTRIRDSFKHAYITKLDWNLHRMRMQKKNQHQSSINQNLLDKDRVSAADSDPNQASKSVSFGNRILDFCGEVFLLLSCCYCCYCCGACHDDEEH